MCVQIHVYRHTQTYLCIYVITINEKKVINLKEQEEVYRRGWREEIGAVSLTSRNKRKAYISEARLSLAGQRQSQSCDSVLSYLLREKLALERG